MKTHLASFAFTNVKDPVTFLQSEKEHGVYNPRDMAAKNRSVTAGRLIIRAVGPNEKIKEAL